MLDRDTHLWGVGASASLLLLYHSLSVSGLLPWPDWSSGRHGVGMAWYLTQCWAHSRFSVHVYRRKGGRSNA